MKKKIMFAAIVAMAMVAVGKGTGAPAEDEVFVKFLEGYYLAPDAAEARQTCFETLTLAEIIEEEVRQERVVRQ